jgi:transcriptional regulator with XRE-family HTH domain
MEKLREIRKNRGLTTVELASKMGTTRGTITRWETGQRSPDVEALRSLAKVLKVSIDELVGNETDANPTLPRESRPGDRKRKAGTEPVKRDKRKRSVA